MCHIGDEKGENSGIKSDGIELPNDKEIKSLEEDKSYNYLGDRSRSSDNQ